jgi:hypothetical protein
MKLSYKGLTEKEALANLTQNVEEQLRREGLEQANFQAFGVDPVGGKVAIRSQLDIPETFSLNQREMTMKIVGEECAKFRQQRYGLDV